MRSTETFPITAATSRMARSASAGPWRRPSLWSTAGSKDCTPIETRVTPASRQASGPGARRPTPGWPRASPRRPRGSPSARAASTTRAMAAGSQSDGVPPPRKRVAQGRPAKAGARRRISSTTAAA